MSTKDLTHEAVMKALADGTPLTHEQRAAMLGLVADNQASQREADRLREENIRLRAALAEAEKVQTPGIYTKHLSAEQTNVDTLVVGTEGWTPANTAKAEAEPVAWRWVPSAVWKDSVLTEDPARAALAREAGIEVKPLYLHPPRRESAELSDEDIARHTLKAGECPPQSEVVLVSSLRRLRVLRAAGGKKPRVGYSKEWCMRMAGIEAEAEIEAELRAAELSDEDAMVERAWQRFQAHVVLTDEQILALWSGSDSRPVLGKKKVLAFARAVLRAAGGAR